MRRSSAAKSRGSPAHTVAGVSPGRELVLRVLRLVFFALLVHTLHEGFELGQLLRGQNRANARPALLPQFFTLRVRRRIGRMDFRARVIHDRAKLLLLIGREL